MHCVKPQDQRLTARNLDCHDRASTGSVTDRGYTVDLEDLQQSMELKVYIYLTSSAIVWSSSPAPIAEDRMAKSPGLFGTDALAGRLKDIGDRLKAYVSAIDFEIFWPDLKASLAYRDGVKDGRLPFDAVMLFRILINQPQKSFGDDRTELPINYRESLVRLLGLSLTDQVPDAKTI